MDLRPEPVIGSAPNKSGLEAPSRRPGVGRRRLNFADREHLYAETGPGHHVSPSIIECCNRNTLGSDKADSSRLPENPGPRISTRRGFGWLMRR
jgi:hypothetical protein